MKKTAVIFLLFIFLFNTIGYFIVFRVSQLHVKEAMKKDIENGILNRSVERIIVKNNELASINWLEKDEFEYKSERYDILDRSVEDDVTVFYCVHDKKETHLFNKLADHVKGDVSRSKSDKNSSPKSVSDTSVKIIKHYLFSFDPVVITLDNNSFLPVISNYKFALISAPFQPPELA
jgi:hypothetical protein